MLEATKRKLTLNQVLTELGYQVITEERLGGRRSKSVYLDGGVVEFPEGTLPEHRWVTRLENVTASVVWEWLHATGQVE